MKLYHYTSLEHLRQILTDGKINLSASNLLRPINPHMENRCFVDDTDNYKPVVWFTSLLDFDRAVNCGLSPSKTEAAIQIESPGKPLFRKWDKWAIENSIEKKWFDTLKETAPLWKTFYITETPVKINETARIIFRPDIQQSFQEAQKPCRF